MPKSIKHFKDKNKALKYRNEQRKINYRNGGFVEKIRGYRPKWTKEDDLLLLTWKKTDRELCQKLHRSVNAIQKRRWKKLNNLS